MGEALKIIGNQRQNRRNLRPYKNGLRARTKTLRSYPLGAHGFCGKAFLGETRAKQRKIRQKRNHV